MNIVSDTYIFYADVYFLQNFLIKIVVIYISLYCNKYHSVISNRKGIGKIILAASIGTIVEIIGLLFGNSYHLFLLLVHVFEIPFMILFVIGKERRQVLRIIIGGYFFLMLINGVLEALWNWFGEYENYVFLLSVSCGFAYIGVRIYLNERRMEKGIFQIEILHDGKQISTYGFYDSGNQLVDPYTKKGVHIISEQLWKRIGLEQESAVLVPYQALGKEDGIIKVYYVEELFIVDERQQKKWFKCPVGVTKENLFNEQKYEIILNEEVF